MIISSKIPLWKRALDVTLVGLTAPITLPIAVIITGYIKLVSTGPVIFKQQRVGINASDFICYKFRSMRPNVSISSHQSHLKSLVETNSPMEKIDNYDDRLIPGARFLRASGLDELPQLINVLKGDMSLVGPRPCLKYEFEYFKKSHKKRFEVLPGLTGLWQVSGKNKTTFSEMVNYDVAYATNHNFLMDLKIIFSTFKVLYSQLFPK